MRTAAATLFTCLLISCGAPVPKSVEPEFERSFYSALATPPSVFASMDLPYYGGQIERASESYMQVSYGREATVEQLKARWPAAVKAAGWVPRREDEKANGGFSGQYTTPSGITAALTINPLGLLWMVDLTLYPEE